MNINEEFISLCKENEIPLSEGFLFGIILEFQDQIPGLKQFILNEGFFDYERYQPLQINLCVTNPEILKPELKVPLFGGVVDGEYEKFLETLRLYNIGGSGHLNSKLEFSIFDKHEKVDRDSYFELKQKLGKDFDLNKICKTISIYYESSKYATKLASYMGGSAIVQDYKNL